MNAALDLFESRTGFLAARGVDVSRIRFSTRFFIGLDYYTGFEFRLHDPSGRIEAPLVAGGRYDKLLSRLGSRDADPGGGLGRVDRAPDRLRERVMNGAFVIAVPAKGRLQEHTDAFFARAGLELVKPRGERDYRGAIKGLPGVEVAYLSASEITLCWRRAPCTSASPAKTWCARRCPIPTPRSCCSKRSASATPM